jgi:hypothetical protein
MFLPPCFVVLFLCPFPPIVGDLEKEKSNNANKSKDNA